MNESMRKTINAVNMLYECDEYGWIEQQITVLREGRSHDLDAHNLIKYLDEMNRATQKSIRSAFTVLLQHLLKITIQPQKHTISWNNSIRNAQEDIKDDIEHNPGLQQQLPALYAAAYTRAKRDASSDTGLPENEFPDANPWITWQDAVAYKPPEPPVSSLQPIRKRKTK